MSNTDYIRGQINELNMMISKLTERKQSILYGAVHERHLDNFNFMKGSYAGYLQMMTEKREPVENPRIVYQGEPGAYSEIAVHQIFGKEANPVGLQHFDDAFTALQNGTADYAVLPIENSSTGAIRQVYDLLEQYHYFFVGETTVEISHALMALPGTKISDIEIVYSHEQGLFQCEQFLNEHPDWKTIAQDDTAGSAKMVAEKQNPHSAAICSAAAAEIYGLEILKEKVNSNSNNTTRFVVVSPIAELRDGRDKICVSLTVAHNSGSLHNILSVFAIHGVNLVRLESRPIPEHNWEYMFFIEFLGDLATQEIDAVIHEISLLVNDLRVLGNFKSCVN